MAESPISVGLTLHLPIRGTCNAASCGQFGRSRATAFDRLADDMAGCLARADRRGSPSVLGRVSAGDRLMSAVPVPTGKSNAPARSPVAQLHANRFPDFDSFERR